MLLAQKSPKTPEVYFDEGQKIIRITGRSYPEDLHAFWDPIISQIENIITDSASIEVAFDLDYHNSGSTRIILNLIAFCNTPQTANIDISLSWYFDGEDEQTREQGEDYQHISARTPFYLIEKNYG